MRWCCYNQNQWLRVRLHLITIFISISIVIVHTQCIPNILLLSPSRPYTRLRWCRNSFSLWSWGCSAICLYSSDDHFDMSCSHEFITSFKCFIISSSFLRRSGIRRLLFLRSAVTFRHQMIVPSSLKSRYKAKSENSNAKSFANDW